MYLAANFKTLVSFLNECDIPDFFFYILQQGVNSKKTFDINC